MRTKDAPAGVRPTMAKQVPAQRGDATADRPAPCQTCATSLRWCLHSQRIVNELAKRLACNRQTESSLQLLKRERIRRRIFRMHQAAGSDAPDYIEESGNPDAAIPHPAGAPRYGSSIVVPKRLRSVYYSWRHSCGSGSSS
jgi:hypothetical protein